jgi:RNA polymerase sigma factor (sigma-70 family)
VDDDKLLAVNDALDKLAAANAVQAEVVKLRYFVGMTNIETAAALGLSERTVKNYWTHARAWLLREINAARNAG